MGIALRFLAVFLPVFVVMVSSEDNILEYLGIQMTPYLALFSSALLALLTFQWRPVYMAAVVLLGVFANLPSDVAANLGVERDYAAAVLLSVVVTPFIMRHIDD